jgi:hypothetical protein
MLAHILIPFFISLDSCLMVRFLFDDFGIFVNEKLYWLFSFLFAFLLNYLCFWAT